MVNYGNQILGLSLEVGSLEDLVSSDRYDLISMIQVISHFYDLQKALTTATAMTNPNGYVSVMNYSRKIYGHV